MIKLARSLFVIALTASSTAFSQVNGQMNCQAAYGLLTGAARGVEFAANSVANFQNRIYQQQEFNALRRAQFDVQRQQLDANEQAQINFNRGNTGACAINSFLFGFRAGNCAPAAVNNGLLIRINFNNQRRILESNRQNFERFAQTQLQRMAQNMQLQMNFFNQQKQRCYDAQNKANNCVWPFTNAQPPQYPAVSCDLTVQPPQF